MGLSLRTSDQTRYDKDFGEDRFEKLAGSTGRDLGFPPTGR